MYIVKGSKENIYSLFMLNGNRFKCKLKSNTNHVKYSKIIHI